MPRIHPLEPDRADATSRSLLDGVRRSLGATPNLMRTLAHSAAALAAYVDFGRALGGGVLGRRLQEQIALAVAGANGCDYCASAHTAIGKKLGLAETDLAASLLGSSDDLRTAAALAFARRVVEARGRVTDSDLRRIRQAGYSDGEIIEIVANVAMNLLTNYVNHVAQTEVDFPVVQTAAPAAA